MRNLLSAVVLIVVSVYVAHGQSPGDVGSFQCRATQISIQNAVTAGEPYRNHGALMRTVSGLVSDAVNSGVVTDACGQCIQTQFARRIPIADQTACGSDPVCGDGLCSPGEDVYGCAIDCGSTLVGVSTREIPRSDSCGRADGRACESLVGDVTADAMRTTYSVDFAITNSGGLRDRLTCPPFVGGSYCPIYSPPPYPITRGQVFTVLPFLNIVVTLSLNGAELKTMLENGVSQMPSADGRFPQVSGLCFTYDISAPVGGRVTGAVRQAADGTCTGPTIDLTALANYTLAENDFMAGGGSGYPNFIGRTTARGILDQVVSDYVQANTPISPSINGRIVCTTSGGISCPVSSP